MFLGFNPSCPSKNMTAMILFRTHAQSSLVTSACTSRTCVQVMTNKRRCYLASQAKLCPIRWDIALDDARNFFFWLMLLAIFATSDKESLASEATQTKTKTKTNKPNTNKQPRHQRKGHSRKTKDETVKRSPDSHLIFDSKKWPDTREWYRYAGSGTLLQSSWTATQSPLLRIPNTYKQTNTTSTKKSIQENWCGTA